MQHIERLRAHIAAGTLIRGAWTGTDERGRETACLLAALVPQCGIEESASVCPASVMPPWLAHLTPRLDDNGTVEAWPGMVERFASLASRWHALDADAWRRVKYRWLASVVREAMSHTSEERVIAVCERVATLCDGVVATGTIDTAAFLEAAEAAKAEAERAMVAWAAAADRARAARAEAVAKAEAERAMAAWAAAAELAAAAAELARAAAVSAWAAEEAVAELARAAAWAAAAAAWEAAARARAWDRITVQLFEAIERELEVRS